MGHAISFYVMLNGRETLIVHHNSHYLTQLISEGIWLSMNNYMNHIWLKNILHPIAPNLTPNRSQTMMGEWNLPPHFVPIQNSHLVMDLPFFTLEIATTSIQFLYHGVHMQLKIQQQMPNMHNQFLTKANHTPCTNKLTSPRGHDGRSSGAHQLNPRINNGKFKFRRGKSVYLHGEARI